MYQCMFCRSLRGGCMVELSRSSSARPSWSSILVALRQISQDSFSFGQKPLQNDAKVTCPPPFVVE